MSWSPARPAPASASPRLLALVSRILRLESHDNATGEDKVGREQLGLDDLESVTSAEEIDVAPPPEEASQPAVDPKALANYRSAFQRLFTRGGSFIAATEDPTLAGWAFTYLLRLVEELGTHRVDLAGRT